MKILSLAPEEHTGRSMLDLVHPGDRQVVEDSLVHLVENPKEIATFEYRLLHNDSTWRTLESTASNLLGQPAVAGIVLNSHDITDRKRAEEKLLHDA